MLSLTKTEAETWLQCIERYAEEYGLVYEVQHSYSTAIRRGSSEEEAAGFAASEWDLFDFVPDEQPTTSPNGPVPIPQPTPS